MLNDRANIQQQLQQFWLPLSEILHSFRCCNSHTLLQHCCNFEQMGLLNKDYLYFFIDLLREMI